MQPNSSNNCFTACLWLLLLGLYLLLVVQTESASLESTKQELQLRELEPKTDNDAGIPLARFSAGRHNQRAIWLGSKLYQASRSKLPMALDLLLDSAEGERSKRFDDYGHMRFGKRGGEDQFDDYGHMRFGR
ncbi:Dsk [Drosophila busckii]|uniref:Drosulfakinins n=1 Tax=Drosophila busckii TaxID=30019 RepID=A0A0M3QXR6_DROBS|nr:drosulfakinins [Drosophila busckii]ALC46393.1 Dsk [Drosophila busckii]